MEHERTIKAGVEVTESLHADIKAEAARRRVKMKDAVRQAFEMWLGFRHAEQQISEAGKSIATKFQESGLANYQPESVKIPSDGAGIAGVDCKADNRPLHLTLERLLASNQRAHVEALLRWAENWLESSAHDTASEEANIISRARELAKQGRRQAAIVLGIPENAEGNESPVRPNDEKPDQRRGKKAG